MANQGYWEKSRTHQFVALVKRLLRPSNLAATNLPQAGYVPSVGADDQFTWVAGGGGGGGSGTVTSVGLTVPAFLSVAGSPVTTSGVLAVSYSGTALPIANGGTGATNSAAARANLGAGTGDGTVTSVGISGANGIGVASSPVTTSGTIALSLGAITPSSVSTGALTASGAISLPSASITRANLVNGAATSVIGRSANSAGAVSNIAASVDNTVLARVSGALAFSSVTASMMGSIARGVIGRGANSTGVQALMSATTNGDVLRVGPSGTLGFGTLDGSSIDANAITYAKIQTGAAKSVMGVAGNATANYAAVSGSVARQGLFVNSANTGIGFRLMEAADLPGGNWMNATNGTTVCTTTSLVSNVNAWEPVTGSLNLPSAGTYLIFAQVSGQLLASAISVVASVLARIYNVTDAAVVGTPVNVVSGEVVGVFSVGSASIHAVVTIASPKTIRIEGMRRTDTGTVYTSAAIDAATATLGGTSLSFVRLA